MLWRPMDTTLDEILRGDKFTVDYLKKLNKLLKRLFKTKYRHAIHINNIMWSNRLDDFRIVDWECTTSMHLRK